MAQLPEETVISLEAHPNSRTIKNNNNLSIEEDENREACHTST